MAFLTKVVYRYSSSRFLIQSEADEKRLEYLVEVVVSAVCAAGGYDDLGQYRDDILQYSPATETWTHVASMTAPRGFHAVSSLSEEQGEDLQIYCDQ